MALVVESLMASDHIQQIDFPWRILRISTVEFDNALQSLEIVWFNVQWLRNNVEQHTLATGRACQRSIVGIYS